MLKTKRILEGKNISSVLVGEELESLTINKVESKKELNILIEELKHLKSALEHGNSTNKKETKKPVKAEINTSKKEKETMEENEEKPKKQVSSYGVKLTPNTESEPTPKNKLKKTILPDEIKNALDERFPDLVVNISDLRINHSSLYSKLTKVAKDVGVSPKEFLLENGYGYSRKERNKISNWSEEEYHSLLEQTYPQKEISAKYFRVEQDGLFYNLALSFSRKQKMNIEQYLENLGYTYNKKRLKAS